MLLNNTVEEKNEKLMSLNTKYVKVIFVYYTIIFIISLTLSFLVYSKIIFKNEISETVFCIFLSLVGSTIYYSRKLYKACINTSYNFIEEDKIKKLGTIIFFLLRPFFSLVFAWVTHLIWQATIISSVDKFTGFSNTYFLISGILGFSVGFLTGRIITRMETFGEKHLNGVW